MTPSISVLIATYNGETYLTEQIDSIIAALTLSGCRWQIYVSDDHSSDGTLRIIESYREQNVVLVQPDNPTGRAERNFEHLLLYAKHNTASDYYILADQDDFWRQDRVSRFLEKAAAHPAQETAPFLAFSNAAICDASLAPNGQNFWDFHNFRVDSGIESKNLAYENCVQGAAAAFNRPLLEVVQPGFSALMMHDHYLALLAASFGRIVPIHECLISYRQHDSNAIGARKARLLSVLSSLRSEAKKVLGRSGDMARFLIDTHDTTRMNAASAAFFTKKRSLQDKSSAAKKWFFVQNRPLWPSKKFWVLLFFR